MSERVAGKCYTCEQWYSVELRGREDDEYPTPNFCPWCGGSDISNKVYGYELGGRPPIDWEKVQQEAAERGEPWPSNCGR